MRLDLERDGDAVADVNDAGVFLARADEDFRRLGRESLEQRLGVFVAAMLAPHHGKDAELGVARRAAEDFHGVGVFFRREVVLGNQLWGDGGFGHGKIFNSIKLFNSRVNFRAKLNFNPNKVKLSVALGNQKPKSNRSPLIVGGVENRTVNAGLDYLNSVGIYTPKARRLRKKLLRWTGSLIKPNRQELSLMKLNHVLLDPNSSQFVFESCKLSRYRENL